MKHRILVLLNARARGGQAAQLEANIAAAFAATDTPVHIKRARRHLAAAARQAIADGYTTLVAAGGDGTIRTVAAVVASHDITLGVIPVGTFNHFAKDAGIPLDLTEAVQTIITGQRRPIDYFTVNGRFCLNSANLGLHAVFVRRRQAYERIIGKWLAIPVALAQALIRFNAWRFTLSLPHQRHTLVTPVIFIGHNDYQVERLGLPSHPQAKRGDLSIYTLECQTRRRLLWLIILSLFGQLRHERYFRTWTAQHCQVNARSTTHITLDGELIRLKSPLNFEAHPGGLTVLVPSRS